MCDALGGETAPAIDDEAERLLSRGVVGKLVSPVIGQVAFSAQ